MTTCSRASPSASVAADKQLWLKAGEKMLFAGGTKGLALDVERLALKVVDGDDPAVHRPRPEEQRHRRDADRNAADGFPVALGVIYEDPAPTFESAVVEQNAAAARARRPTSRRWSPRARPGRSKRNRTRFDLRRLIGQSHPLAGRLGCSARPG